MLESVTLALDGMEPLVQALVLALLESEALASVLFELEPSVLEMLEPVPLA
jgi:hypothetical protein